MNKKTKENQDKNLTSEKSDRGPEKGCSGWESIRVRALEGELALDKELEPEPE